MESQRAALKVFYQTQLDDLVRSKVDEYQKQFDDMEKSIRKETKQNERLIAERALKQIELITQKYVWTQKQTDLSLLISNHWISIDNTSSLTVTIRMHLEMNRSPYYWRKNIEKKWNCVKFDLGMPRKLSVNWNRSWVSIAQNGKNDDDNHDYWGYLHSICIDCSTLECTYSLTMEFFAHIKRGV